MKTYFPTINLLRGIAALAVCVFHFTNFNSHWGYLLSEENPLRFIGEFGANGVFIFFVISGFVIPMSLHKEEFSIKFFPRFFTRRFIRVELPYIASIIGILAVNYLISRILYWDFEFNIKQFGLHLIYLIPWSDYPWYNIIFWTLAIEIQYYIVMAFLFILIAYPKEWVRIFGLLLFGASSLVIPSHNLVFYYAPIFLLGICLFMIKTGRLKNLEGLLLLTLFSIEIVYLHNWVIALFSIGTVVAIAFTNSNNKIGNRLGDISYSLYLVHGVIGGQILYFLGQWASTFSTKLLVILIALIASFVSAYLFWLIIERPSQRLSKRIRINKS